jgi:glycosyltransferase involved in cell wall biosynthesis
MQNNLVSIIIPTYNRKNIISRAIKSCLNQIYKYIEIIIIDDCSQDNTYKYLLDKYKDYNNIKIFQNIINLGPGLSRNIGVEKAFGKYITFLDDDDLLCKNCIKLCIDYIDDYDLINCHNIDSFNFENILDNNLINDINYLGPFYFLRKKDFIEFKNIYHEDLYWSFDLLYKFNRVKTFKEYMYIYDCKFNKLKKNIKDRSDLDAQIKVYSDSVEFYKLIKDNIYKKEISYFMENFLDKFIISRYNDSFLNYSQNMTYENFFSYFKNIHDEYIIIKK